MLANILFGKICMKFTADSASGNVIRGYVPGEIRLGDEAIRNHVIVSQDTIIRDWQPPPLAEMSAADFQPVLDLKPEIILFGSGNKQRFPSITLMTEIMRRGVAIEVMETAAACRTYNVLIGEFRAAVAALLLEPS